MEILIIIAVVIVAIAIWYCSSKPKNESFQQNDIVNTKGWRGCLTECVTRPLHDNTIACVRVCNEKFPFDIPEDMEHMEWVQKSKCFLDCDKLPILKSVNCKIDCNAKFSQINKDNKARMCAARCQFLHQGEERLCIKNCILTL